MEFLEKNPAIAEYIINAVHIRPTIFNKTENKYLDNKRKQEAFANIASIISQDLAIDFSGDDVKNLWNELVEHFKKHHKIRTTVRSGDKAVPPPHSAFYPLMLFMLPHIEHRDGFSSLSSHTSKNSSPEVPVFAMPPVDAFAKIKQDAGKELIGAALKKVHQLIDMNLSASSGTSQDNDELAAERSLLERSFEQLPEADMLTCYERLLDECAKLEQVQ